MKQTHPTPADYSDIDELVNLVAASSLLKEKTRISLYLPKVVVKIMDSITKNQSRSQLVKTLVVEKAQKIKNAKTKTKQDPYGIFADAASEFDNVDNDIKQMWDEALKKVDRQINNQFD